MIALLLAAALVPVEGPGFITDLRYARADNVLKRDVYGPAGLDKCWARPELAAALGAARDALAREGLRLVLWDCWRPLTVQREMWSLVPDARYVADPAKGSHHNRGAAVDVTLADEKGRRLEMPTGFDDFSPAAAAGYECSEDQRRRCLNRDVLRRALESAGLVGLRTEWWHFQLPGARALPLIESLPPATK